MTWSSRKKNHIEAGQVEMERRKGVRKNNRGQVIMGEGHNGRGSGMTIDLLEGCTSVKVGQSCGLQSRMASSAVANDSITDMRDTDSVP